ncbi:hypothetical protein K438DRAFT_1753876 [Mycena galopus ATCC 62051]|nr:hypothetical protein K438DRAFT_1753876 [Mycena galopus ATCC 62051]
MLWALRGTTRMLSTSSLRALKPPARGLSIAGDVTDTNGNTEGPQDRARVLDRIAHQLATGPAKWVKTTVKVKKELKCDCHASAPRATSVPVKCVARTPAPPIKPEPASLEKKLSLYTDVKDSDNSDIFQTDSSTEMPLATTLAASRAASCTMSGLSSLAEDEDVPMPAATAIPAAAPISPSVPSVSSLSASSATLSAFSSISGALCTTSAAAGLSALLHATVPVAPPAVHMLFNRKTLVLYDNA